MVNIVSKKILNKIIYDPLESQPDKNSLLPLAAVQIYYSSLKACVSYRKRVTWVNSAPTTMQICLSQAILS